MSEWREPRRKAMVGWYDPRVLAHSGWQVTIANLFGRHSDTRLIEALASQPQTDFDYSAASGDFWLDYAADLGDGFNPTYAVAQALAEPELAVTDADGKPAVTQAGRVLVFGGDAVYPYPSRAEYETRTEAPYATAFAGRAARPDVFAVPGNHDWYDSLIAFSRLFCRPERGFAGCRTRQTRSYFALQLPSNWWLVAIDLQLGADLDEPQLQYFKRVAERMDPQARLIMCVPEPRWILEDAYPRHMSYDEDASTQYLESQVFKRRARVFLTGDLHFYKRHENPDGVQKITAGGGGAFLHPTHAPATHTLRHDYVQRAVYPDEKTSARLTWRNFLFPVLNPKYLWLPAFLYAMSAWLASASLEPIDLVDFPTALAAAIRAAIRDPFNGLWLVGFIGAFIFFTDTHMRWWRVLGGASHALAHLAAAFLVGWAAYLLTTETLELLYGSISQLLVSGLITFVAGGIVGALIMGIYLFISLQIFGRHSTEAFSSLRIQDYKHWLRLRIDAAGRLTIFAIGIDRVSRRWRRAERNGAPTLEPYDARATAPRLIDRVEIV
jgi:hypothetical protein